jgi:hypothetical protein
VKQQNPPQWPYNGEFVQVAPVGHVAPDQAETIHPRAHPPKRGRFNVAVLIAGLALGVALVVLGLLLISRAALTAQVGSLSRELGATQAQLSAAADKGGTQISGLSRSVGDLRRSVDALSGLASFTGDECTADATSAAGHLGVYVFPCRS